MRRPLVALLGGLALALIAAFFTYKASAKMADFEVYWHAGTRALAAEPLYRVEDEHYQLKYLPAFAILASPAALLPLPVAKAVWLTLSVALIPLVLQMSLTLLPARQRSASVIAGATLLIMAKFYGHELVLGQVNLLLLALVLAAVHLLIRDRPATAGLLVALAVVIKPYAVIFLPWLLAMAAFRALGAAVAGAAITVALPVAVYGVSGTVALHAAWWQTVTESTAPNLLNPDNVSLAAMFSKWFGQTPLAAALAAAGTLMLLGLAAFVFALRRRVISPEGLEAGLLLTLMPLLSPQGWDYVFLLGTPAVMYLVNYDRDLPGALRILTWVSLAVVALTLYDVMGRRAYGRFMAWSAISVCFLVVIAALTTLRARRVA